MKTDFDLLSTAPPEESCVEVGSNGDPVAEGNRYIKLLIAMLGNPPKDSYFKVKANSHDFGTYYTVAYYFDDENQFHINYMKRIENDGPLTWND